MDCMSWSLKQPLLVRLWSKRRGRWFCTRPLRLAMPCWWGLTRPKQLSMAATPWLIGRAHAYRLLPITFEMCCAAIAFKSKSIKQKGLTLMLYVTGVTQQISSKMTKKKGQKLTIYTLFIYGVILMLFCHYSRTPIPIKVARYSVFGPYLTFSIGDLTVLPDSDGCEICTCHWSWMEVWCGKSIFPW